MLIDHWNIHTDNMYTLYGPYTLLHRYTTIHKISVQYHILNISPKINSQRYFKNKYRAIISYNYNAADYGLFVFSF